MRPSRSWSIPLALLAQAAPARVAAELPLGPHATDLRAHQSDPPGRAGARWLEARGGILAGAERRAQVPPRARRTVYGYFPYWISDLERVRFELLTHIAYFAVELASDGTTVEAHGWPDAAFVEVSRAQGLRVDVTFTLFSGSGIEALCASPENRARAITTMVDAMEAGGADGVNVDFEGVESSTRDNFTTFIRELRAELTRRGHAGAGIAIAGPAVDYSAAFDLGALAEEIDVYFIMGYGYHWGRSSKPGPVGQLRVADTWRPHLSISMERTLAHYTALVPGAARAKIILGVPYYGYDWPAASGELGAATTGSGSSRTYAAARRELAAGRERLFDAESENAWYTYVAGDGVTHQTWYDDEESLAGKYQLVQEQGIGVGMWALGYDEDHPELWDTLDAYFTEEPTPLPGTREAPIELELDRGPFEGSSDTRLAPSSYFNTYACDRTKLEYGREWVYRFTVCGSGRLEASLVDPLGVDVDLHLLRDPEEEGCVARHDTTVNESLMPGTYWLVADTYVQDYVARPGEYTLSARFLLDDPGAVCPPPGTAGPVDPEPEGVVELPGHPAEALPPGGAEVSARVVDGAGCGCAGVAPRRPPAGLGLFAVMLVLLAGLRPRGARSNDIAEGEERRRGRRRGSRRARGG